MSVSNMRPILYTDLDDTLFQTARKMSEPISETRLAAIATNGRHSYMTEAQFRMTQWLLDSMRVIPVTARSTYALSRCHIRFHDWRIAANGGVILAADQKPDREWQAHVSAISRAAKNGLEALEVAVTSNNVGRRFRHWIVHEDKLPIYFCVKSEGEETWLDDLEPMLRGLAGTDFLVHRNGNNLSFTPHGISKFEAVSYLDDRIGGPALRFGMGDSLTDLPFMGVCTMMIIPRGSQIDKAIKRE